MGEVKDYVIIRGNPDLIIYQLVVSRKSDSIA